MYPILYYLLSASLLAALIYQCQPVKNSRQNISSSRSTVLFLGLALLLLTVMRIPSLFYNRELNVDESQLLAQAITTQQDPVYGRSVDGTSIGPINTYLLLIPAAFGLPLDYTAARLTALLLIATALVLFYHSLLRLTTPFISRLSFLPVLLFFAFTTEPNFLHYSSELSSLVILTACFRIVVGILQQVTPPSSKVLVSLGVLAGLTVYCKLQTLPIIGMMLITSVAYLWHAYRWAALRPFLMIALGFLIPTIVVFGQAYWFNTERYFIDFYFVGNLTTYSQIYAQVPLVNQGFVAKLVRFPAFIKQYADFLVFIFFNSVLVVGISLLAGRFQWRSQLSFPWVGLLIGLTAVGAFWSVITPGTEFGHHLLLLVFPLGWGLALALRHVSQSVPARRFWLRLPMALLGLYVLEVIITDNLLLAYSRQLMAKSASTQDWQVSSNPYLFSFPTKTTLPLSPVSQVIKKYTQPSDKIAVWGWNCRYYVETGLAQGVRENHTQRSSLPNWMQKVYLNRYVHDLVVNRPAVFVDAVGQKSVVLTKPQYQHEHFADLDRVIHQNYNLVDSVDQARIYVKHNPL